jgi:hypothetical protein
MLASISYRYLKYGVISESGAQAQNGNDAPWNSEEIFVPFCALFVITIPLAFRLDLRGSAFEQSIIHFECTCFHSVSCSEIFSLKSVNVY